MAVYKRTDRATGKLWIAEVSRKGILPRPIKKAFDKEVDAKRWEREQERQLDTVGLPLTIEALKKVTVGDIVQRYLNDKTPHKGCKVSEKLVLERFLLRDICKLSLATVSKQDAYKYRDIRLKETWKPPGAKGAGKPITARTVRRECNSIQHVFQIAKEEWGYSNLLNPFLGLKITYANHSRERRLKKDGELTSLLNACDGCHKANRIYMRLAIHLALETAMRQKEIFNLRWQDIDFKDKTIDIVASKTDHMQQTRGRKIVLPYMAEYYLKGLRNMLIEERAVETTIVQKRSILDVEWLKPDELIFKITQEAFKGAWQDVKKRANITVDSRGERLEFRDLRREAASRFGDANLNMSEHARMMGHKIPGMQSVYNIPDLKNIRKKLDTYQLQQLEEEISETHEEEARLRLVALWSLFAGNRFPDRLPEGSINPLPEALGAATGSTGYVIQFPTGQGKSKADA